MMKDVSSYFKVVSKEMRRAQMVISELREKETRDARALEKLNFEKEKRARILEGYARSREARKQKRIHEAENRGADAVVENREVAAIEAIFLEEGEEPAPSQKRVFHARPLNWQIVAEYYGQWGKVKTVRAFPNELENRTDRSADQALKQWLIDFRAQRQFAVAKKAPAYGHEIDQILLSVIKERMATGLPTDDVTLRMTLLSLLKDHNKTHLLVANGGVNDFQHGWACRFWKRHKLASRVATTKMRILPANFAVLEEQYISIAAKLVYEHTVPPDLVYGQDETNAQFVSRPNKTRAEKGAKRIRLLGVGAEKPQITVTFTLKENGDVVNMHQMIFGGKTKRCEPQNPAPDNVYYDHTESHWQTPASYIRYLEDVVIPDKDATIARLRLPRDQKALVIHDLHYSHKDKDVLEFMNSNNLLSLYIPAGCTDVMQTCDTVANKPFKVGLKAAFRDFLYIEHEKWEAANPDKEARGQWDPKLTLGALKEKITGFVTVGMDALKTPEMKISIANAFARDSRFAIIRSAERQEQAGLGALEDLALAIMEGDEPEVPGEAIPVDNDQAFTAFMNNDDSSSDEDD